MVGLRWGRAAWGTGVSLCVTARGSGIPRSSAPGPYLRGTGPSLRTPSPGRAIYDCLQQWWNRHSSPCRSAGAAGEGRGSEALSQSSLETEAPWGQHGFWHVSFHLHKLASRRRQQHREKRTPMITSLYSPGSWMVCWTATTTDCAQDWEVG